MSALGSVSLRSLPSSEAASVVDLDVERLRRRIFDLGHFVPSRSVPEASCLPEAHGADQRFDGAVNASCRIRLADDLCRGPNFVPGATVLISTCLHAALLAAVLWSASQTGMGVGGVELHGISVEIVSSAALESTATPPSATAARATVAANDSPPAVQQPEQAPQVAVDTPPREQPNAQQSPDDTALQSTEVKEPPPEPMREADDRKMVEDVQPQQSQQAPEPASVAGGASANDNADGVPASAAAGASPGALSRYAVEIRLALGKFRPRHGGSRGRVLVSFVLDEKGEVRFVEIAGSSGSSELDAAARAAVLRAKFPTPPSAMTELQRTYTVPFDFK